MRFLDADDVARAVVYAASQPPHAAISEIMIRPTQQGS
jgi:NADP-dependent 3-hydroxy acid dehydrogenase YdfG